ncbi:alpha-mannosidase [Homoserinibacter sp. YIM 151385]|uniref:alpha-mannosidase n=1 Tax=Homoserinibacter sp. YIM 151385 TaxID=2985506 RepID=UPI0022F0BF02|nr:glycoside hydrolase family 38 C-terminal domain-containing protein [Homoserinibacter sp. YIM 151385]WBU37535.1 glycosyl hydrolase-related protein [Homoserinibacter sp. YIM 151385]
MHDTAALITNRIRRFRREQVRAAVEGDRRALTVTAWRVPGEPVEFDHALAQSYEPIAPGDALGAPWSTCWLHVTGELPETGADGRFVAEASIDLGFTHDRPGFQSEGLVWTTDGRTVKGVEPLNSYIPLSERHGTVRGGAIDFYVEAASNPDVTEGWQFRPTRLGDPETAGTDPAYRLGRVDVLVRDTQAAELEQDLWTLAGLLEQIPADSTRHARISRAIENAMDAFDPDDVVGSVPAARAQLADVLASPASASAHRVVAVGHAHIDSAWLWPVRETVRKCARTFSNVLDLMDADPDFVFAASSAQQYAWVERVYPELFQRIAARVAEGRWVPVGGMWVESDTNLPGGEALARQFVMGTRYFQDAFGIRSRVGWLPDSFGYSAALPQILRRSGLPSFLSQKISWNETNTFPHHTFEWEGIDGSRVFTHFPPVDLYNSVLSPAELAHAERNFADKADSSSSLVPFGHGDGGGGPTREMLAASRRAASLEGSPRVRVAGPEAFFDEARAEYATPPVWSGEMYLELHRGTYTSQARTKRGNRRSESLLHEAELWATTAALRAGHAYPAERLTDIWRRVLLHQFHDVLPGSSIAWVHREAERDYELIAAELEQIIAEALAALSPADGERALANSGPFAQDGILSLGAGTPHIEDRVEVHRGSDGVVLQNAALRAHIDADGHVVSLVDRASGRESVPPGQRAAVLELYRDTPNQWDAWDIDAHYRRHRRVLDDVSAWELDDADPSRPVVRVTRAFGGSTVVAEISLSARARALDIAYDIDWHENQKLLKAAFPIDVHAESSAAEIQFGHVRRSILENTSWDAARFETSGHRWVHVGETGFGAALANDASYGHDVTRNPRDGGGSYAVIRQSLLRAPRFPDPRADEGRHRFALSVRPGASVRDAVEEGYRLAYPLRAVPADIAPIAGVVRGNAVIETVKLAEDGSGDLVLRLYEPLGERGSSELRIETPVDEIWQTDLIEERVSPEDEAPASTAVDAAGAGVVIELAPFQIVTLRARRAS